MQKAWHRSPFSKQVLEYLEDEISSSPTPISHGYDAGKCPPILSSLNFPDSLARTNLHFPCLSICLVKLTNIFNNAKNYLRHQYERDGSKAAAVALTSFVTNIIVSYAITRHKSVCQNYFSGSCQL